MARRHLALRRAVLAERRAGEALGDPLPVHDVLDAGAPACGAWKFPRAASAGICLSSVRPVAALRSRASSASRSSSRFTWSDPKPRTRLWPGSPRPRSAPATPASPPAAARPRSPRARAPSSLFRASCGGGLDEFTDGGKDLPKRARSGDGQPNLTRKHLGEVSTMRGLSRNKAAGRVARELERGSQGAFRGGRRHLDGARGRRAWRPATTRPDGGAHEGPGGGDRGGPGPP